MKNSRLALLVSFGLLLSACSTNISSSSSKESDRSSKGDERVLEIVKAIQTSFKENGAAINYFYHGESDAYSIVGAVNKSEADAQTLLVHSSAYLLDGWSELASISYHQNSQQYSRIYGYDAGDISVKALTYADAYDTNLNDLEFDVYVSGSTYKGKTTYQNARCVEVIETIGFNLFGDSVLENNYGYDADEDFYYTVGSSSNPEYTPKYLMQISVAYLPAGYTVSQSSTYNREKAYYKSVYTYDEEAITVNIYTYTLDDSSASAIQYSVFLTE